MNLSLGSLLRLFCLQKINPHPHLGPYFFFSPSYGVTLSTKDFLLRKGTSCLKAGEDRDSFFSAKQENSIDA